MKQCPACRAHCFDDAKLCYECLYEFADNTTDGQAQDGQVVSDSVVGRISPAIPFASGTYEHVCPESTQEVPSARNVQEDPSVGSTWKNPSASNSQEAPFANNAQETTSTDSTSRIAPANGTREHTHTNANQTDNDFTDIEEPRMVLPVVVSDAEDTQEKPHPRQVSSFGKHAQNGPAKEWEVDRPVLRIEIPYEIIASCITWKGIADCPRTPRSSSASKALG